MGKWCFLRNSNNRRTVKSILLVKKLLGLVEMTSGLVNASLSLPEWQAVKMIFFAPWMRLTLCGAPTVKQGQTTTPGAPCPTLIRQVHRFFNVPCWLYITLKTQKMRPTIYRPYPRRAQHLSICRCHCRGSMFPSVILRPWLLVRSVARTRDLSYGSSALYQLS